MAERNDAFWKPLEVKAACCVNFDETDFTMGDVLVDDVERNVACDLVLVGPILDAFITRMGKGFVNKLRRGNTTGIMQSAVLFIPRQIFSRLAKLSKGYGALVAIERNKTGQVKNILITFNTQASINHVWHHRRMGYNYLIRRKFNKIVGEDGSKSLVCTETARVVTTASTPVIVTYNTKKQTCTSSFYVQRYNQAGMAIDAALQAQLNG